MDSLRLGDEFRFNSEFVLVGEEFVVVSCGSRKSRQAALLVGENFRAGKVQQTVCGRLCAADCVRQTVCGRLCALNSRFAANCALQSAVCRAKRRQRRGRLPLDFRAQDRHQDVSWTLVQWPVFVQTVQLRPFGWRDTGAGGEWEVGRPISRLASRLARRQKSGAKI